MLFQKGTGSAFKIFRSANYAFRRWLKTLIRIKRAIKEMKNPYI